MTDASDQPGTDRLELPGANGVRLRGVAAGPDDAPLVVLLHAMGESTESWAPLLPALAASYRVVALDLRGHGVSDWPGQYTAELMAADVAAVLDGLGADRCVLVGHSLGGMVSYLFTITYPDRVRALVIEDAPPPYPRDFPLPDRPDQPVPFDWDMLVAIRAELDSGAPDWAHRVAEIAAPTLMVAGGEESHLPQDRIAAAADLIGAELVTLGGGHFVHDARPDEFTAAVLGFLAEHAAAPS